jgi:hypothetical protein
VTTIRLVREEDAGAVPVGGTSNRPMIKRIPAIDKLLTACYNEFALAVLEIHSAA